MDMVSEIVRLSDIVTKLLEEDTINKTRTYVSCEPKSTDAIRLVVQKSTFLIEIFPHPNSKREVAIFEFHTLKDACKMFEALHFYRNHAVIPFIDDLQEMI